MLLEEQRDVTTTVLRCEFYRCTWTHAHTHTHTHTHTHVAEIVTRTGAGEGGYKRYNSSLFHTRTCLFFNDYAMALPGFVVKWY
uniref:Uncharacterized protein n=1 Tax=Trichogramma kaykai TaxID=54128 RepID=A0ABD2WHT8_9HYME